MTDFEMLELIANKAVEPFKGSPAKTVGQWRDEMSEVLFAVIEHVAARRNSTKPKTPECTWSPTCTCEKCRAAVGEMRKRGQRDMLA